MSNYVKTTNFAIKDTLVTGNPNKIVKGSEVDVEFENIQSAVNSKTDANNSTMTGTASVENITVSGTFTGTINGGTY